MNLLLFDDEKKDQQDKEIEELNAGSSFQLEHLLMNQKPIYRNEKNFSLLSAPELLANGGSQRLYFHQLAAKDFRSSNAAIDDNNNYSSSASTSCSSSSYSSSSLKDAEIVRHVFSELPKSNSTEKKSLSFDVVTVGNRAAAASVKRHHHHGGLFQL